MNTSKIYLMDRSVKGISNEQTIKYIAKSYKPNGDIVYYKDGEKDDGFADIIEDLQKGNNTFLISNKDRMKATFEFLEELKFSVENATLKIIFKDNMITEEITFSF